MDADGAVKHRFGGAGFHSDGEALDDFTSIGADHMQADHTVGGIFDQQLHEGPFGATAQGMFQRFKLAFEHSNTAKLLARIGF